MKYIKVVIGAVVLVPVVALASLNIMFCGTDVVYISSDGKWSERQMVYRNREFKDVVSSFEKYKLQCNTPDVRLEKLRSRQEWIVLSSWFNNQSEIERSVPLSGKFLDVNFGFSTPKIEPAACYTNV